MEKKTELLKTLEFLTSLGYDNVQGLSISIKYDEITIRATFDGFSERGGNVSKDDSNCNKPAVISSVCNCYEDNYCEKCAERKGININETYKP